MATSRYVDSSKADDSGDGLAWGTAKKHISAALATLTYPLTDETTIYLKGTTASPKTYEEDANDSTLDLTNILLSGADAVLIFQAEEWNPTYYAAGTNPFTGSGALDPTAAKPVVLAMKVVHENAAHVEWRAVEFTTGDISMAAEVGAGCQALFSFCRASASGAGFIVNYGGRMIVENCYATTCGVGVAAANGAWLNLTGDNHLIDNIAFGVGLRHHAQLVVTAWETNTAFNTLTVKITKPRRKYAALAAAVGSTIYISGDTDDFLFPGSVMVKLLNAGDSNGPDCVAVKLESKSMLVGAGLITFRDSTIKNGLEDSFPKDCLCTGDGTGTSVK
jgi:hypothetical protein